MDIKYYVFILNVLRTKLTLKYKHPVVKMETQFTALKTFIISTINNYDDFTFLKNIHTSSS